MNTSVRIKSTYWNISYLKLIYIKYKWLTCVRDLNNFLWFKQDFLNNKNSCKQFYANIDVLIIQVAIQILANRQELKNRVFNSLYFFAVSGFKNWLNGKQINLKLFENLKYILEISMYCFLKKAKFWFCMNTNHNKK